MHPEVLLDGPGSCPVCGMASEPMAPSADDTPTDEYRDTLRRFVEGAVVYVPLLVLGMGEVLPDPQSGWVQGALATPVVLWGGWSFFVRGWESVRSVRPNMLTLIAVGVGVAWGCSVFATLSPGTLPPAFRHGGRVPVHSEAAVERATLQRGRYTFSRPRSRA